MEFSRQEYWRGLPFPSPGDLPDPGIKPRSPVLQADSLPTELAGKAPFIWWVNAYLKVYFIEKATATHSSVLAWRIPGMGEPGELPSMGSHRVGHD